MWLAGKTEIACADPQTGVIRAKAPLLDKTYISSIAPPTSRLVIGLENTSYSIASLTSPATCG